MPPDMPTDEQIRRRIEKRIKERNEFYVHLAFFIGGNLLMWLIWFLTNSGDTDGFPWPLIVLASWGIGIVAHGLTVYFNSPARVEARERTIQREIERERQRLSNDDYYEKPKRDRAIRLTDDGELIEITDEEEEEIEKRKRDR